MLNDNTINPERFISIGSVLGIVSIDNAVICGAGVLNPECIPYGKPKMIVSVRGPLTRKWLMDNGIECPERYGDPAMLLPKYYRPKASKDNSRKPILIPHCASWKKIPNVLSKLKKGTMYWI